MIKCGSKLCSNEVIHVSKTETKKN